MSPGQFSIGTDGQFSTGANTLLSPYDAKRRRGAAGEPRKHPVDTPPGGPDDGFDDPVDF